jgi:glutamate-1-semialdehyde aminotransferase
MPLAAVAGRRDILEQARRGGHVRFSGGTYSGHPACLLASKSMLTYLAENEKSVYPYIGKLASRARETVEKAFAAVGIGARCTGTGGGTLPQSSISTVVFPYDPDHLCKGPEDTLNPHVCDVQLANRAIQLALLLEGVHVIHGLGSICTAHREADIAEVETAYGRAAERIKSSL